MAAFRYGASLALIVLGILSTALLGDIPASGDPLETYLFTMMVFAGGVGLFSWGFGRFRRLQLIRNTPTSKIRSMAMGTVEVKGEAGVVTEMVESPLTGQECVYYEYKVEEYESSGKNSHWKTIDSGSTNNPIGIADGTGAAVVETSEAEVELPEDEQIKVGRSEDPPERIQRFIENSDEVKKGDNDMISLFDDKRRYTEWYIEPGDDLYVFGYAEEQYQDDGVSYPTIKKGDAPMFYVTDHSEEYLQNRWGWTYKAMILGGILLIPLGYLMMAGMTGIL